MQMFYGEPEPQLISFMQVKGIERMHDYIVSNGWDTDDAIESIMNQYAASGKQTIIALDKQQSYTPKTSELLENYAVLKLAPNGSELFGRSWGKRN